MALPYTSRFTEKEYLALEAVADIKHEFFGGYIVAMAGADPDHNQIVQNVRAELTMALAERPCRITGADQRVIVEAIGEYFYPDVVMTCLEPRYLDPKPRSLANPQVIVEVLSQTTERYDRGDKWSAYQMIPSLTDYVMLATERRELVHYRRSPDGSWTLRTLADGTTVVADGVVLDVGRLYRLVPGLG
jgi:Uma2 family endonuclease